MTCLHSIPLQRAVHRRALAVFVLGALLATATAQAADFVRRTSNVFGNFLVGAAVVSDSGSFSEFLSTPALVYSREAADAGAVNGSWNGTPIEGSASFASGASYVFESDRVVGQGHAETTGATPYDHVSLGANAISLVRLEFTVSEITPFVLTGSVLADPGIDVGPRVSQGSASVQFSGCIGCLWNAAVNPGAFSASGLLIPGNTYSLRGSAGAEINGSGQYAFDLMLGPVDEPAAWMLVALGLPLLLLWRRQAGVGGRGT